MGRRGGVAPDRSTGRRRAARRAARRDVRGAEERQARADPRASGPRGRGAGGRADRGLAPRAGVGRARPAHARRATSASCAPTPPTASGSASRSWSACASTRRESILDARRSGSATAREREIETALDEIAKIAALRLRDRIEHEEDRMNGVTSPTARPRVPVYRVRDNQLMAVEVDVEVLGENFLPAYTRGRQQRRRRHRHDEELHPARGGLSYEGATLEGFLAELGRRVRRDLRRT